MEQSDLAQRCSICRCYMDSEDLFCANCGTENPHADVAAKKLIQTASPHSFTCKSCGASMSYDASAKALRCPFCGSTDMEERTDSRSIKPLGVVPLRVNHEQAESILRQFLSTGFWRPGDAAQVSSIGEITSVYVPYWVFVAATDTRWTADSSNTPMGARGNWYPITGSHNSNYNGILISGSSVLTPNETNSIAPFQLEDAVPPEQVDLANQIVEEFRVPRKLARPLARGAIEFLETEACTQQVPGRARNVKVNVSISSMGGDPMLLPVWVLAYRYKERVYRVLINGQTGKIAGDAPFSYHKLTAVIAIVGVVIACIVVAVVVASQFVR